MPKKRIRDSQEEENDDWDDNDFKNEDNHDDNY
jgi:hypothetical protein